MMDLSEATLCYLFLYGGFGFVFLLGLFFGFRLRFLGFRTRPQRRNLTWMLFGYAAYATVHGLFTFYLWQVS